MNVCPRPASFRELTQPFLKPLMSTSMQAGRVLSERAFCSACLAACRRFKTKSKSPKGMPEIDLRNMSLGHFRKLGQS